jgi:dephospho-CoA kinase
VTTTAIAITGGIASGKSAVADLFRHFDVPIFDADIVAREVVQPGAEALQEIAAAFGNEMLTRSGELDRHAMRARVFANANERLRLEAILHPRVRAALLAAVEKSEAPYCLLVIPLLTEHRADYTSVDRMLVVDVSPETQKLRLVRRDRSSEEQAARMIAAQALRAQRLALADDVVDNSGELAALEPVIERLHRMYLRLAERKGAIPCR